MPKNLEPPPPDRPAWAKRLDRIALIWSRIGSRVLPRPDEAELARLARRHRPPPEPMDFEPADYGIVDHLERGRAALKRGDLGEALHHFGQRILEAPEDSWAQHGRGDALQLMGQSATALSAYERAIELAPGTGLHHGGRANALAGLGRLPEAEVAWKEALHLDPGLTWMRKDRL